jgi:hypothetical protein
MVNQPQNPQFSPEWLKENNRRVIFQQHMYNCSGRANPDHPMHCLFTGLWQEFCLNEAGYAQRDQWFDRMQFVQDVKDGKIKLEPQTTMLKSSPSTGFVPDDDLPRPEEEIAYNFNASNPVDEYLDCSSECKIDDKECEDDCVDQLKEKDSYSQCDSPHQAAIAR